MSESGSEDPKQAPEQPEAAKAEATKEPEAEKKKEREQPKKIKLFVAVTLSIATTRKIAEAEAQLRRAIEGKGLRVTWVPPANLHVTLKFLGWANPDVAQPIADMVAEAVRGRKAFEISARGFGAFPNETSPRVLWAGVQDPSQQLAKIAADVDKLTEQLGFAKETRAFSPHVTIGRVKEGKAPENLLGSYKSNDFGISLVRDVILYESSVTSKGSEYIALARMPLDAPAYRAERQTREVEGEDRDEEPENGGSKDVRDPATRPEP